MILHLSSDAETSHNDYTFYDNFVKETKAFGVFLVFLFTVFGRYDIIFKNVVLRHYFSFMKE